MVEMAGFETTTTSHPTRCAPRLLFTPNFTIICFRSCNAYNCKNKGLKKKQKKEETIKKPANMLCSFYRLWLQVTLFILNEKGVS